MPLQKTFGHSYNKNKSNEIFPLAGDPQKNWLCENKSV
jgi:hypothetical protein